MYKILYVYYMYYLIFLYKCAYINTHTHRHYLYVSNYVRVYTITKLYAHYTKKISARIYIEILCRA